MKILPIWQPVGFSTHLITQKVGEKYGVKTSHTGTLDPMAQGVVIVLLGEERLKKFEYAKWQKEYEFEIVFGISTDSYDGMGLITNTHFDSDLSDEKVKSTLKTFVGRYKQKVPPLSTKKIKGRHLHEYFRSGETVNIPEKEGTIYKLELLDISERKTANVVGEIIKNVSLVTGDFRQKEIIEAWKEEKEDLPKKINTAKLKAEVSKGLYIRSLVQDIASELNTMGFANKIVRTKNGKYRKKDCRSLEDVFGKNYKKVYDFNSRYKFTMVK